ncbi:hypothetical protein EBT11_09920, partial [bacterium]|nr:hypothetical protein [bacterium]
DKCKQNKGLRHLAFRLYSRAEADALAKELETMLFLAGYTNKVKRTSCDCDLQLRVGGGEYVRVKALLG